MNKIPKIKIIYILSFIFSLHIALSAFINSTFLTAFFQEKYVGLLYTISSIITLILLSTSSKLLKKFGNRQFVIITLLINMLSLVGLISSHDPQIIGISFITLMTTDVLVLLSIDIFVEHFGNPENIGKTRGIYLTITNLAWMITPIFASFLIVKEGGYKAIYIITFIITAIMSIGLVFSVRTFKDKKYKRVQFLKAYKYLKTNYHILSIVVINFILRFFYAFMTVYTPIYLFKYIGFNWSQIGIIFTIMLVPFVILGLPVGILIDKYHISKKTLLYIGFIIMSISTIIISYITTKSIVLWSIILFMAHVGASIIETTSEIYFFTNIKEEEEYLLGIFRDMRPVSLIVAPLIATVIFLFAPFKAIFIILGIITFLGVYYVSKLKNDHLSPQTF